MESQLPIHSSKILFYNGDKTKGEEQNIKMHIYCFNKCT